MSRGQSLVPQLRDQDFRTKYLKPELNTNKVFALSEDLFCADSSYSHSIVPGGLDVISKTTRLTPRTSLIILLDIFSNRS